MSHNELYRAWTFAVWYTSDVTWNSGNSLGCGMFSRVSCWPHDLNKIINRSVFISTSRSHGTWRNRNVILRISNERVVILDKLNSTATMKDLHHYYLPQSRRFSFNILIISEIKSIPIVTYLQLESICANHAATRIYWRTFHVTIMFAREESSLFSSFFEDRERYRVDTKRHGILAMIEPMTVETYRRWRSNSNSLKRAWNRNDVFRYWQMRYALTDV